MSNPTAILLIEDNYDIGTMVKKILATYQRKRGGAALDFVFAPSAEAGVNEVRQKQFDLILMDYQMPGHDGVWATKQIKGVAPETPIVFLSAYTAAKEVAATKDAGAVAYVAKTIFTQMPVVQCLIDRNWTELKRYADNEEVWLFSEQRTTNK